MSTLSSLDIPAAAQIVRDVAANLGMESHVELSSRSRTRYVFVGSKMVGKFRCGGVKVRVSDHHLEWKPKREVVLADLDSLEDARPLICRIVEDIHKAKRDKGRA